MKKTVSFILIFLLLFVFAAGCGAGSTGGGASSGGSVSSSSFTKPENPLDLDFDAIDWSQQPEVKVLWAIAQGANSEGGINITDSWADAAEKTQGKLKFELSADAVLVDESQMLESLESGLCQIVKQTPSVNVGLIPELECLVFPGFFSGTPEEYADFCRAIQAPVQAIYDDYGYKIFAVNYTGRSGFLMKNKQVTHPNDLKGMLLRASGATLVRVIETYGASATVLGLGDVPQALDRGTIDGMFSAASMMVDMHFTDVAPYLTVIGFREMLGDYSMSQSWYNSLTPEMQAAIDYYGEAYFQLITAGGRVDNSEIRNFEKAAADGTSVVILSSEESEPFADSVKPLFEEFGKNTSPKGLDLLKVIYDFHGWDWTF